MKIDPEIQKIVGTVDFDPEALQRRYDEERDKRLHPKRNKQFVEVTADFAHYVDDPYVDSDIDRDPLTDEVDIIVIGGGFGGVLAGARLRQAGFENIRVVEKGGGFGGTWYWNRYPGAFCDTESYVYFPMLEEVGYVPRQKYSPGYEIREHIERIAKKYDLYRDACFQTAVTDVQFDDAAEQWIVRTDKQDEMRANFIVMSNGPLDKPKLPGIPGINEFKGHTFHTSRWDYGYTGGDETGGLTGLADKKVGVIGTGATAIQCIPYIGASAQHLYVFQRTPAAVDIRANRQTDKSWEESLKAGWHADRINNFNHVVTGIPQDTDLVNDGFTAVGRLLDPTASWAAALIGRDLTEAEGEYINEILDDKKMNEIRDRIDQVVEDAATADALKPWHRRWCKRPLFSDEYLPTFNRPNVTLVDTNGKGVERFTETAAVVGGQEYELDCLIFATGFEVGTALTRRTGFEITGRSELKLSDHWANGMRTFHGLHSRGFPNCVFMGFGQNASATNFVYILDEQSKHVAETLKQARARGAKLVEASEKAVDAYVAEVNPLAFSMNKFWVECTPSYFNGEGTPDDPNGFFANVHPAGTVGFYDMLRTWREAGDLTGLELS